MDHDVQTFAQVMAVIVSTVTALVILGLGTRILWRLGSRAPRELPAPNSGQLERIENMVEAMAVEVERISEAQRFTATLLNDRLVARADNPRPDLLASALRRHDTPQH